MCVTNIYTDRYPDGQESKYGNLVLCRPGAAGQLCPNHQYLENLPRVIQYDEPSSAQMFAQSRAPNTPPTSSASSNRPFLGSDDGVTTRTITTTTSGGSHRSKHGSKSSALLGLFNSDYDKSRRRKHEKERRAKKEKVVTVVGYGTPSSSSSTTYARSIPGQVQWTDPTGAYVPTYRQSSTVTTRLPDTPPVVFDASPPTVTVDEFPSTSSTTGTYAQSQRSRSVSPVRLPERERRPHHSSSQPPVIIHHPPRSRDPSPPNVYIRAPSPPPNPPAPAAAEIPYPTTRYPSRSRSPSRTRPIVTPSTPSPNRHNRGRREYSPDPIPRRSSTRRDESLLRRQRFAARDEEILNRPSPPSRGESPSIRIERERRPYTTAALAVSAVPVIEQSRRLNDMMGGLNIRNADDGLGFGLDRRNTVGGGGGGGGRRGERHRVLYDDGVVRYQ